MATAHVSPDASAQTPGWGTTSSPAGVLSQPTAGATIAPASNGQLAPTIAWSTAQPQVSTPITYAQPSGLPTTGRTNPDILTRARPRMGVVTDSVLDELAADSALWQRQNWDGTITIPVRPSDSFPGVAVPTDPAVQQDPTRSPAAFAERLALLGLAAGLWGGAGIRNARKRRAASPALERKPLEPRSRRDSVG